jgi:hypothetical protein
MAHVRKDTLAKTVQWWKHLRPYWKRRQQRRERVASAELIRAEWDEQIERKKTNRGLRRFDNCRVRGCALSSGNEFGRNQNCNRAPLVRSTRRVSGVVARLER